MGTKGKMLVLPMQIIVCLLPLNILTSAQESEYSEYWEESSRGISGEYQVDRFQGSSDSKPYSQSSDSSYIGGYKEQSRLYSHQRGIGNDGDEVTNGNPASSAILSNTGVHSSSAAQAIDDENGHGHRSHQHFSKGQLNNNYGNGHLTSSYKRGDSQANSEREVCYDLLGCFKITEPWKSILRPVPAPMGPENNSAVIYFYSRPYPEQRYLINLYPKFSLGDAKFDPRRRTVVIVHGFMQDGNEAWMEEMKNAYLKHVDANVMLVNWGEGANRLSYLQVTGNTRLIGRMVANFIKSLMQTHGARPRKFHLIGHSLGAQIASYIAKEVPHIGRLTALDPAQPAFEGFDKQIRLDRSDAEFVDVVHTNGKPFIPNLGLGMIAPYGHVDFYVNGGFDQPLCVAPPPVDIKEITNLSDLGNLPFNYISRTFICDHNRAYAYLVEAFNNTESCTFWGHKATAKNVIQTALNSVTQGLLPKYVAISENCTVRNCIPMGFATEKSQLRGIFVVTTNGKSPYCKHELVKAP